MATKKNQRDSKQQLGQFMTPETLVNAVMLENEIQFTTADTVLEPSLGTGHFVFDFVDRFLELWKLAEPTLDKLARLQKVLSQNLYGVEYDAELYERFGENFQQRYGFALNEFEHHFYLSDFFRWQPTTTFTYVIGNPPFGGTFDSEIEDALDREYGIRNGEKIKKETYAFFIVKCLELLAGDGVLVFILSDTFLTINTMRGLRRYLTESGEVTVEALSYFSPETNYGMVVLRVNKQQAVDYIKVNGKEIPLALVNSTPNYSWGIQPEMEFYFGGPSISQYMIASSGMTVGKNELFLRKINDSTITEHLAFNYEQQPIKLANELARARLNKISPAKIARIQVQEAAGETKRNLAVSNLAEPTQVALPSADYRFYNKAVRGKFWVNPGWVIFWKDEGDAVYTYKRNGAWYLHGVGGKPFFKKEGLTWNLISSNLQARYLPEGYILDSGAPVAILRPDVDHKELWFLLGWLNTNLATRILKEVINHTKNIQSKDVERLPYPFWVGASEKTQVIELVSKFVTAQRAGAAADQDALLAQLEELFKPAVEAQKQ